MDLTELVADFSAAADQLDLDGWPCALETRLSPAPHTATSLPPGKGAVYMFALSAASTSAAGAGMVLKVGKAGPKSNARFQSQHYGLKAGSTLAGSLIRHPIVWPWLGVDSLNEQTVAAWMKENLDRAAVFVPGEAPQVLSALEMYARARMGSVFEGSA